MTDLPKYNRTRGPSIVARPGPFDFSGVTVRSFPLRADETCLKKFVKEYLQLGDDEAVRYDLALPYVFLSFLNYGTMSQEAAGIGLWSQFEVVFQIPLEWYVRKDDKWVFHDWTLLTPYILVDDPTSIGTGREVYGWPKERGWVYPELDAWRRDHSDTQRLLSLRARTFSPAHAGKRIVRRELVNVGYTSTPLTAQLPPDPRLIPLYLIPRAIIGSVGTLGTIAEGASRLLFGGSPGAPRKRLDLLVSNLFDLVLTRRRDAYVNVTNLKQFRDSVDPQQACYQSVVNAKLEVADFRGAGPLGDVDLLRGDRSGGYEIEVHDYEHRPIVRKLGLHVASSRETDEGVVDTLRPQLPFWVDLDLHYALGDTVCWRAGTSRWTEGPGPHLPAEAGDKAAAPYSEARGAPQVQAGPFEFRDVTTRIFPLKATAERLQAFCDTYLNDEAPPEVGTFTPILPLVFMFVTNFEGISEDLLDLGRWADREIMFAVPTTWKRVVDDEVREDTVLVTPYVYADSSIAIATGREVSGWPTIKCELMRSHDVWIDKDGPLKSRLLAEVRAGVFRRLYAGERQERRVLLTIKQDHQAGSPPTCMEEMEFSAWQEPLLQDSIVTAVDTYPAWAGGVSPSGAPPLPVRPGQYPTWQAIQGWDDRVRRLIVAEVSRLQDEADFPLKGIEGMVDWLEKVHSNQDSLRFVNLKQFRDSTAPDRACYQAMLLVKHEVTALNAGPLALDPVQHGASFDIRIRAFPNEPIVETLGLDAVDVPVPNSDGEREYELTVPTDPFWVDVNYTEGPALKLCSRARVKAWSIGELE